MKIDLDRMRAGRLARLQASMRAHNVEACILLNDPNIRYATGASAMPVWSMSTFVRCAVVPQEGKPILFEHGHSIHRSELAFHDVRPMRAWEFREDALQEAQRWARDTVTALRELGVTSDVVAVDRLGTPGYLGLRSQGLSLLDSAPITQEAREVKTPEEVQLFELNGEIVVEMLGEFEDAIRPGISERALVGVLSGALLSRGGEYLATNTVCSGENANPWRAEATDRTLRSGELVYVDTDSVAVEGYFYCVSRTFPVGDEQVSSSKRDTYRAAHDWLQQTKAVIRPGLTCSEVAQLAPRLPDRFVTQRYPVMVHSIGLEEESPSVCNPQDPQWNPDRALQENMVLVVECYMGEVGGDHGVKLGDQLVVTANGIQELAPYPYADLLLG